MAKKTAILIYCTHKERDRIKHAAKLEHRTISGFVMNAVTNRLAVRERLREHLQQPGIPGAHGGTSFKAIPPQAAGDGHSN